MTAFGVADAATNGHRPADTQEPAEYVTGAHLAELIGRSSSTWLRDALDPDMVKAVTRWHRRIDEYGVEAFDDVLAVPVALVKDLLPDVPSRADVAQWAADTCGRDPHDRIAEQEAERAAACARAVAEAAAYPAPTASAPTLTGVIGEHAALFDASSVLRHVRQFAAARGAGELATLGNVLARAALAVPHPVTLPPIVGGPVSLNTLLVVAGVSGAGKDIAHAAAEAAVVLTRANGAAVRWEPHPVGTGEGIGRTFATGQKDPSTGTAATVFHRRSALFVVRDIAAFDALGERRGQTLVPELLKAAMGQELGHANATVEHRVILPPHSYRLALSAGVQPGNGSSLLSESAIRDGLTQRFLWLPVRDGRRRETVIEPDPLRIAVPDFGVTSDPLDDDAEPPALAHLDVAEQIRREIVAVNDEKDLDPFGSSGDPLAGHRLLAQLKAAAALAVLHGRTGVDMEAWQWGGALVAISDAVTAEVAARSNEAAARDAAQRGELDGHRQAAADAARESVGVQETASKFLDYLNGRGGDWIGQRVLTQLVTSKRRNQIEPALRLLAQRGQIEVRQHEYQPGKFTPQFRVAG